MADSLGVLTNLATGMTDHRSRLKSAMPEKVHERDLYGGADWLAELWGVESVGTRCQQFLDNVPGAAQRRQI